MVVKSRQLQRETLQQILEWERNQAYGTSIDTGSTYAPTFDDFRTPSPAPSTGPIRAELYSLKALEKALATNITPLLRFSAMKDFSGENISFLKHVQDWKSAWSRASAQPPPPRFTLAKKANALASLLDPESLHRHQFAIAVEIYVSFVSPYCSDFPINISCAQSKDLESIFSHAASTLDAHVQENTATPFDAFPCPGSPTVDDVEHHAASTSPISPISIREKDAISIASTAVNAITLISTDPHNKNGSSYGNASTTDTTRLTVLPSFSLTDLKPRLARQIAVPLSFGPHVFDEAERAVKYVVLTNTWPKFVAAGIASKGSRAKEAGGGDGGTEKGDARAWTRLWGGMACARGK
jgi:hypothetical protein